MSAIIANFALAMATAAASFVLMWVVGVILKKLKATPGLRPRLALYAILAPMLFSALALFYKAGPMLATGWIH